MNNFTYVGIRIYLNIRTLYKRTSDSLFESKRIVYVSISNAIFFVYRVVASLYRMMVRITLLKAISFEITFSTLQINSQGSDNTISRNFDRIIHLSD